MPQWQQLLDEWLRTHHGVINLEQCRRLGISERTIYRMVERGQLITLMPGVFLSRQWPLGRAQTMVAACARNEHAVIARTTAASSWHLRKIPDLGVQVLVPHGSSPTMPGVTVHRCRRIDPVDVVARPDGIRLTSPPRTLFDCADVLGIPTTASVLEQMLHEKMITFGTITDTLSRLGHPRRPGTSTLAAVIRSRPVWQHALQSDLEHRVLQEIERQGLPRPVSQCPVALPTGRTIHLDFGWPTLLVGLEVDDPAWHAGFEDRHRDMHRDRKAATVGWAVPRVSKIDVDLGLREAIRDVAAIIALRSHPC